PPVAPGGRQPGGARALAKERPPLFARHLSAHRDPVWLTVRTGMIDLNADLGESFGGYRLGRDADLIPLLTSAQLACGFHAGDPRVMDATVGACRAAGVAVGAHPSFPDLVGFG